MSGDGAAGDDRPSMIRKSLRILCERLHKIVLGERKRADAEFGMSAREPESAMSVMSGIWLFDKQRLKSIL